MIRTLLAIVALLWCASAHAQGYTIVASCGSVPSSAIPSVGHVFGGFMDANGNICTNGAGSPTNTGVTTSPGTSTPVTEVAFTVTTGGTFQQLLGANSNRTSCLVQNNSTHVGYVYFLGSGTASLLNAVQIPASGGTFTCQIGVGGGVIKTAILFTTSTTGDPGVVGENQ